MPDNSTYIEDSLELNLFYLRIMKEHALFLQLGFTPKNRDMGAQAENIRMRLDDLMKKTIQAARGYVSPNVINSGELYTRFTEQAEHQTQAFTGVTIDIQITVDEQSLGGSAPPPASLQQTADWINYNASSLTKELNAFQERVMSDVKSCIIFTGNYPLSIEHIISEAQNYLSLLDMLTARRLEMGPQELSKEEAFWNEKMEQHAQFIDGLLDPTETAEKRKAAAFAVQFASLTKQAVSAERQIQTLPMLTRRTIPAAESIKIFKEQGTEKILSCKLKSIIPPLLSDHQLRESNYYLRILRETIS